VPVLLLCCPLSHTRTHTHTHTHTRTHTHTGKSDFLKSDTLAERFEGATVWQHKGGHELPTKANGADVLAALQTFLEPVLLQGVS
jgi:hypothetical protein